MQEKYKQAFWIWFPYVKNAEVIKVQKKEKKNTENLRHMLKIYSNTKII